MFYITHSNRLSGCFRLIDILLLNVCNAVCVTIVIYVQNTTLDIQSGLLGQDADFCCLLQENSLTHLGEHQR